MPLSAVDSITPAIEHVKQQLFRPFSLAQWTLLALVGMFAGESCSGGGLNFNSLNLPSHSQGAHRHWVASAPPDWVILGPLIALALITIPVVWLFLLYLNSRMRFVLFDSVVARRCAIGRMWRERRRPALEYFVWQVFLWLAFMAGMVVVVGLPLAAALLLGWISSPREHMAPLILTGIAVFAAFTGWFVLSLVVHVFTKDFVVPQMALENISAFEGWRRLWRMLQSDKAGYLGYGAMKFILAIAAAFVVGLLAVIAIILLLIPFGGLAAITVIWAKVGGLTWNAVTITAAIVAAAVLLVMILYVLALISVPVIVFFPAYSIYFFASRYSRLANLVYPPPPILPLEPV
ncbi:MAG: hypothetical protein J2P13_06930 [Acidobacteria bacterium]|nr:hypothetical protein [Acidobacteriota bacterium]